ncbi:MULTISPECIES: hypothetical protein [Streptomyces]|uniref:hypothetical protein n=1 Tax=Streptomyces TaxID=1883 RepID=UPI00163B62A5|nr:MULTISPECIES: hypothetical protein [Streptomyces]MBC2873551.1 hypothetical protein [Streptomyces sp. TYQ1024]UBI36851.1 hypothetical protein K7I03_10515 [Streptomyces mobaraensis]UKW29443.1 hypothetical protein MCU78_10490 [Streptomyces sp. TYQ1024]
MLSQFADLTAAAPRRAALTAGAVVAALALTACGSSGHSSDRSSGKGKPGDAKADAGADAGAKELPAGQPSPEEQELESDKKKGKFVVTGQKVVMGKPEDLQGGSDAKKFAGKTVAFAYLKARLADADAPMRPPMMTTDIGTLVQGGEPGRPLITIGQLPGTPSDCESADYGKAWKKGEERTFCQAFVVPQGKKVTHITYRRGFYKEPLKWVLPK